MFTYSCRKIQTLCIFQFQIKRNQVFFFFFFFRIDIRCLECKNLNLRKVVITKNDNQKKKLLFDTSNKKFIQILAIIEKNLKEHSTKIENRKENEKEREYDNNSGIFQDSNSEKKQNYKKSQEKKENNIIEKEEHAQNPENSENEKKESQGKKENNIIEKEEHAQKSQEKKENNIIEKEEHGQNPENSENEKKELDFEFIEKSDEKKRDVVSNDKIQIEEFKMDLSEMENRKDFSENKNEKILKKNQSQEIKIERSGSFSFQSKEVNLKSNPIIESNYIFGLKNVGNTCNKLK